MNPEAPQTKGDHLFVISGCSSAGKSTLIAALAERGESVVMEPGRQIVKEQLPRGGDALPWANARAFIDLCAEQTIRDFDLYVRRQERTFFDRSFIDVACAVERSGFVAPPGLEAAVRTKRYAPLVFIAEPWEALYQSDAERRHPFSEALAEYQALVPTYEKHGYEIAFLPQTSVAERVAFVLSAVAALDVGTGRTKGRP
jgi:predicted ATPase